MIISSWNIRGLNMPIKQKGILNHIRNNKVVIMGMLETKIKRQSMLGIVKKKFRSWQTTDNFQQAPNGRIMIL